MAENKPNIIVAIIKSMRPKQWVKNLLVFAALFFNPHAIDIGRITSALSAFVIFSLLSSGVYLFNDILDRERDRLHPAKQKRPIASGDLPVSLAFILAALFIGLSIAAAYREEKLLFMITLIYL